MLDDLVQRLEECFDTPFDMRLGRKTPHVDRLSLKSGGVVYDGTVLYADVVGSSTLGERFGYEGSAKIIQGFLLAASRLVTAWEGTVTAYDGDRVMAVFGGDDQEDNAVATALSLTYVIRHHLNPILNDAFGKPSIARHLVHCCGIDAGDMLAVKVGMRGHTDLFWSGRPANLAAKLCSHRKPAFATIITSRVFQSIDPDLKRSSDTAYWKRFPCSSAGMTVLGTNEEMDIGGE